MTFASSHRENKYLIIINKKRVFIALGKWIFLRRKIHQLKREQKNTIRNSKQQFRGIRLKFLWCLTKQRINLGIR